MGAEKPLNQFTKFHLSEDITGALTLLRYITPTPIQEEVIPLALQGKHIVGKAKTGSGKTAAFAIPLCELVIWEERSPQALVLEPTRELAVQVSEEIFQIGRKKRIKSPAVFGGFPIDKQIQTLRQKSHIVVGTPGRVMDHIRRESLRLEKIKYLVIDEADLMLHMGFLEEVQEIIECLPEQITILLFSATMDDSIKALVDKHMKDAVFVTIEEIDAPLQIEEIAYEAENDEKYQNLLTVLEKENPGDAMIFCATREMVNTLFHKLVRDKIRCQMLHGEMEQKERIHVIADFRQGKFHYLIATDVAARGVDFDNITHVINYDFPTGRETYVHRIGRTGRNKKSGVAISFVSQADQKMKRAVEEFTGRNIPVSELPEVSQDEKKRFYDRQKEKVVLKAKRGAVFNRTITKLTIGCGKKSKMRAAFVVGIICEIDGITAEDIGIIDVRDSITYVEILHGKGKKVLETLEKTPIKGKLRKVRVTKAGQ